MYTSAWFLCAIHPFSGCISNGVYASSLTSLFRSFARQMKKTFRTFATITPSLVEYAARVSIGRVTGFGGTMRRSFESVVERTKR